MVRENVPDTQPEPSRNLSLRRRVLAGMIATAPLAMLTACQDGGNALPFGLTLSPTATTRPSLPPTETSAPTPTETPTLPTLSPSPTQTPTPSASPKPKRTAPSSGFETATANQAQIDDARFALTVILQTNATNDTIGTEQSKSLSSFDRHKRISTQKIFATTPSRDLLHYDQTNVFLTALGLAGVGPHELPQSISITQQKNKGTLASPTTASRAAALVMDFQYDAPHHAWRLTVPDASHPEHADVFSTRKLRSTDLPLSATNLSNQVCSVLQSPAVSGAGFGRTVEADAKLEQISPETTC